MYVIIAGAGKVGWNLARELIDKGNEVTLLESDRDWYLTVEQELEHAVQYGDATELWVLERAGIQRADLVIAVTGDDEDNLLICQVAKEKYLCSRIIARINNPRNRDWFELLGIAPAVSATDLILRLIEHEVPDYGLVHLLDLRDEQLEIIEVEIGPGDFLGFPAGVAHDTRALDEELTYVSGGDAWAKGTVDVVDFPTLGLRRVFLGTKDSTTFPMSQALEKIGH